MKYSTLTSANQDLLKALEVAGGESRKKSARHRKQFSSDPKTNSAKSSAVSVWEFLVDPHTPANGPSPGRFRFLRRCEGSDVTWWWGKHLGNDSSFSFEQITDVPSFKPVKETAKEDTATSANVHTTAVLKKAEVTTIVKEDRDVPDSWEDE